MATKNLILCQNASATTPAQSWMGGSGVFTASATFGGGTVKLQFQGDDGSWIDVGPYTTLTAAGGGVFTLPPCQIRVNIATATAVFARVADNI